jgi:hypothetical protein
MVSATNTRRIAVAAALLAVVLAISLTAAGASFQRLLYKGYGLTIPVLFGAFVLGGVYFGVRHLLTA